MPSMTTRSAPMRLERSAWPALCVLLVFGGGGCVRPTPPCPPAGDGNRPSPDAEAAVRTRESLRQAFEAERDLRGRPETCSVRLEFEGRPADVLPPLLVVAAHTGEWGAPRPVQDQVFVLDPARRPAEITLDPCRPVTQWRILVPGLPLRLHVPREAMSVARVVRLPWPRPGSGNHPEIVYERTTPGRDEAVFTAMRPSSSAGRRDVLVRPGWIAGTRVELGRRNLYDGPFPGPEHNESPIVGPWEAGSRYAKPVQESLSRPSEGWRVGEYVVMGPARDHSGSLELRTLLLFRLGAGTEPSEFVWSRLFLDLPRPLEPWGMEAIINPSMEPTNYEVRDLR